MGDRDMRGDTCRSCGLEQRSRGGGRRPPQPGTARSSSLSQHTPRATRWDHPAVVDVWAEALPPDNAQRPDVVDILAEARPGRNRGLQARLTAAASRSMSRTPPAQALLPRVSRLLSSLRLPPPAPDALADIVATLRVCPPAVAAAALRTWTSAWSTPARQQHEAGFGCPPPAVGDGQHRIQCELLWASAAAALELPPLSLPQRIGAAPTARIRGARSMGPPAGLLMNARCHRRPRQQSDSREAACRLAVALTREVARQLAPLGMRPRAHRSAVG